MSSTALLNRPLVVDTLRAHRSGSLAWIGRGAVARVTIGLGFVAEVKRFAGAAAEMAASMRPGVEAMHVEALQRPHPAGCCAGRPSASTPSAAT